MEAFATLYAHEFLFDIACEIIDASHVHFCFECANGHTWMCTLHTDDRWPWPICKSGRLEDQKGHASSKAETFFRACSDHWLKFDSRLRTRFAIATGLWVRSAYRAQYAALPIYKIDNSSRYFLKSALAGASCLRLRRPAHRVRYLVT